MTKNINELNQHSKEVDELLGKIPSWIMRNGISSVMVVLTVLLAVCWFLEFPVIITAPVVITADPQNPSARKGTISLKLDPSGKVKIGQQVNLKFSVYPYLKYGMVHGAISKVATVPQGDGFLLEVTLNSPMVTTLGIPLKFEKELQGVAEIITGKQRLLNRILNPLGTVSRER